MSMSRILGSQPQEVGECAVLWGGEVILHLPAEDRWGPSVLTPVADNHHPPKSSHFIITLVQRLRAMKY